jgi:hypothetical protein
MVSSKNPGKSFRVNLHFHVAISFPPFLAFCGRYFGGNKPSSPVGKGLLLWPFLESERMIASLKTSRGTRKSLTKDWLFFPRLVPLWEACLVMRHKAILKCFDSDFEVIPLIGLDHRGDSLSARVSDER